MNTQELVKCLDHLSKPSSWLIHCILHPSEEDTPPVSYASQVHGLATCNPTFCKKGLSFINTAEQPPWKWSLLHTGWLSTPLPCRLCTTLILKIDLSSLRGLTLWGSIMSRCTASAWSLVVQLQQPYLQACSVLVHLHDTHIGQHPILTYSLIFKIHLDVCNLEQWPGESWVVHLIWDPPALDLSMHCWYFLKDSEVNHISLPWGVKASWHPFLVGCHNPGIASAQTNTLFTIILNHAREASIPVVEARM